MPGSPLPRWSTVVFDLDGTLVDTIGLIVESYRHAFRCAAACGGWSGVVRRAGIGRS